MPHQLYVHAHYKSKPHLNRFALMANRTKMGLNWPYLGQRCIGLLPSLQIHGEIPAPTTGIAILLFIIMNFVESIRGRIHLYHEIYMKIENSCFCRNQDHQSAMRGPGQVLCINLFSPDFIDCVKAMPPGDRVYGVRWIQQSDACSMKKVRSLEISQVVATITICCC